MYFVSDGNLSNTLSYSQFLCESLGGSRDTINRIANKQTEDMESLLICMHVQGFLREKSKEIPQAWCFHMF
jgi:hypothetical protein